MKQGVVVILVLAVCALVMNGANVTKQGIHKGESIASELYVAAVLCFMLGTTLHCNIKRHIIYIHLYTWAVV